jgi:hypothetical protein
LAATANSDSGASTVASKGCSFQLHDAFADSKLSSGFAVTRQKATRCPSTRIRAVALAVDTIPLPKYSLRPSWFRWVAAGLI